LVHTGPRDGLLGPIEEAHDVVRGHRVHCHSAVEDLIVLPIPATSEGMEGADVAAEVVAIVIVLGLVARALDFQTCPLYIFERVAVRGGVICRVPWASVQNARFAQHSHRIKLWLVWDLALVVVVVSALSTYILAECFGLAWAGVIGVGNDVGRTKVLPGVAGVPIARSWPWWSYHEAPHTVHCTAWSTRPPSLAWGLLLCTTGQSR
jgi:hypothetical protein